MQHKKTSLTIALILTASIILFFTINPRIGNNSLKEPIAHLPSEAGKNKKKGEPDKKEGPAWFAEYHRLIRTRAGEEEPAYEPAYRLKEWRKSLRKRQKSLDGEPLNWIERGPGNVGGRTRTIWVDPTDSTHLTWFAGSVSGGVWKTENGGSDWRHLTEELGNLATSIIMGSAANPDVLYVGTGEGYSSLGVVGNGMWKSTDRGESWFPLESTIDNPKFGHTMRIVVNPEDENEMVVASRLGRTRDLEDGAPRSFLQKSTDGGETWRETWRDSFTIQQVVAHPRSFDTLYAAVRSGGILRSIDAGLSWDTMLNVRNTTFDRIEMAVSPTDPDYVYFAVYTNESRSFLFRSDDAGESWKQVKGKDRQNELGDWMAGQGWYDNAIAVHPFDPQTVYVGGQSAILKITVEEESGPVNTDGSLSALMEPVADGYGQYSDRFETSTKGVHVDHHGLFFIPIDEESGLFYILNANDGGVAFSTDGGETFTQTGDGNSRNGFYSTFLGYNTAQFYGVDKMNGADRYIGGTQDNGSWFSSFNPDAASKWSYTLGGDGFEAAWHYNEPNKILESSQYNRLYRSDDGGENWRNVRPPGEGPFVTRIANSRIDPNMVFCVSREGVVRSLDFADSWEVISMPPQWRFSTVANIIRFSQSSHLVVWTGAGLSEDNRIFVSEDGGSTFSMAGFYEEAELGRLSGLATHPFNEKTAYALFSAADAPKILRTTDMGQNWEDLSGFIGNEPESNNGFPDVAVYSLLVTPFDTNQIWAGTEIGLFESLDGGLNWQYADNGLPPVSIWEMKIVNDEVVLATHGRGIWTVSLPELEAYEPPEAIALLPFLELRDNGLGGRVSGSYFLRSDYDSVFVQIDVPIDSQQTLTRRFPLVSNRELEEGVFNLAIDGLPLDTILRARVNLVGYKNGKTLRNVKQTYVFGVEKEARTAYVSDFEEEEHPFARLDFNIYAESGFDGKALHSRHPYLGFYQTYLAVLNFPIVVSPSYSQISFDEIAMIEPGEARSDFGDQDFYDFVVVEGSRDFGQSWEAIEGYDVRWSENWEDNYDPDATIVDPALMETHVMDLASVFDPGDTIFLRFRLQSDPFVEGWGWVIDNLNIQQNPTSAENANLEAVAIAAFPNPSSDVVHLQYKLEEKQAVKITLHSIAGRRLATLENGEFKAAGAYQKEFDVRNLASGVYLFRFEIGGAVKTIKWLKQ